VRCSRCGNENPALNRFCGMCGATLVAPSQASAPAAPLPTRPKEPAASPAMQPAVTNARPAPAPAQRPPEPVRSRGIEPDSQPIISGPSFLGLNQPGPGGASERGSRSDNAPRSLDYLLEDEEEPKSGAGKIVLIVIALLLALGLGYLRWRNEGLDWLTAGMKKTLSGASSDTNSSPTANGDNSAAANPTPAGAPTANAPATSATNSATTAAQPGAQGPTAGGSSAATPSNPNNDAVIPVDSNAGAAKAPADAAANSPAEKGAAANPAARGANDTNATDAGNAASAPAANPQKGSGGKAAANTDDDAENSDDAESAPAAAKPVPLSKPHAAKPLDAVAEGEKYIYGRGVAQDCDRGVKMVRQAANQSNAKAMISLGAMYSAGLCTPRDLPTAYRWFAIALRKEPDNDSLQADLKKLWSEMTPPERQLAIKLSQ